MFRAQGSAVAQDLPGEHGFRFFPGFYWHVIDTMQRIPCSGGNCRRPPDGRDPNVDGTGRPAQRTDRACSDAVVGQRPRRARAVHVGLRHYSCAFRSPSSPHCSSDCSTLLLSCDERRYEQWEKLSWWEFTGADKQVATVPEVSGRRYDPNTRCGTGRADVRAYRRADRLTQIMLDMVKVTGPSTACWTAHQRGLDRPVDRASDCARGDVRNRLSTSPKSTAMDAGSPVWRSTTVSSTVTADHYVGRAARARSCATSSDPQHPLRAAEPRLARLKQLTVRWMNGVMFYLDKDVSLQRGHAIFIDSEWALTAISQAQFWPNVNLESTGRRTGSTGSCRWMSRSGNVQASGPGCAQKTARKNRFSRRSGRQLVDHIDDGSLDEVQRRREVPRSRDSAPESERGNEPRTAARQHEKFVERPTVRRDEDPQLLPRRRFRTHPHGPGHDGGRQRGCPARRERDSGCVGIRRVAVQGRPTA